MRKLGVLLLIGGAIALVGAIFYLIYASIPLPFKIIVSIIFVGFFLLLGSLIRERMQVGKKESFKDVER